MDKIEIKHKDSDSNFNKKLQHLINELELEYDGMGSVYGIESYRDMDGNLKRIVVDFDY